MEICGFARAGVPGEYSPAIAYAALAADVASTTSYVDILSVTVNIETLDEVLSCLLSAIAQMNVTGGGADFRLSVDGVPVAFTTHTAAVGGSDGDYYLIVPISNPSIGPHVVTVAWKSGNAMTLKSGSTPQAHHVTLLCIRNRPTSDREADGFVQRGWQTIYSCGTHYTSLTAAKTSTVDTITDPLLTGFQITTRYPQSALLIRFNACGRQNDAGAQRNAMFQLYVDGQAKYGTGDASGTSGFTGVSFNTGLMAVVPVQAGVHTLDVYWSGSSVGTGLTINPANATEYAVLTAEEVFCEDVNTLSDMEGFAVMGFASKNLPRVRYGAVTTDITAIDQDLPIVTKYFYVTGEQSALQIEASAAVKIFSGETPTYKVFVDGVMVQGSHTSGANGFISHSQIQAVYPVSVGYHKVQLTYRALTMVLEAATHPEYAHANLLVREVPA